MRERCDLVLRWLFRARGLVCLKAPLRAGCPGMRIAFGARAGKWGGADQIWILPPEKRPEVIELRPGLVPSIDENGPDGRA